jgi:hypothetical protein
MLFLERIISVFELEVLKQTQEYKEITFLLRWMSVTSCSFETAGFSETLACIHQTTRRHVPEDEDTKTLSVEVLRMTRAKLYHLKRFTVDSHNFSFHEIWFQWR